MYDRPIPRPSTLYQSCSPAAYGSSSSLPRNFAPRPSSVCCRPSHRSFSLASTRPTASASGLTTFGPRTCTSATRCRPWARGAWWPSPPQPRTSPVCPFAKRSVLRVQKVIAILFFFVEFSADLDSQLGIPPEGIIRSASPLRPNLYLSVYALLFCSVVIVVTVSPNVRSLTVTQLTPL